MIGILFPRMAFLGRLLMILSIVLVLIAPVMARTSVPVSGPAMMDGMDCCPPDQPAMPDCTKDCPLIGLCMAKCFSPLTPISPRLARTGAIAEQIVVPTELDRAGWRSSPPAPPPRS